MPLDTHRRISSETGSAMVEFALVLPLLAVLLMGMLDFGRALNYWNDVNQIAADGARYAAVSSNPGPDASPPTANFADWLAKQAETGELYNGSPSVVDKLQVCVEYPAGTEVGDPVKVVAKAAYGLLPIVDEKDGPTVVSLRGEAVMRLEVPPDPDNPLEGCSAP
jgi:Flp pilus assembly pilin Flp